MVSCLLLDASTEFCGQTMNEIQYLFSRGYTKTACDNQSALTFICARNIRKEDVWQTVLNLEMRNITVGYGFGSNEEAAKRAAKERLEIIWQETASSK